MSQIVRSRRPRRAVAIQAISAAKLIWNLVSDARELISLRCVRDNYGNTRKLD
jgi:hypothetical protein